MTEPAALIHPMLAMFAWTFAVMLRNVQVRVQAVRRGQLRNQYFELFSGAEPPEIVVKTGNHLRNLFEFPVLFYAAVLAAIASTPPGRGFVALAWAYVALRVAHSIVHLTLNQVPLRFTAYFLSNLVLLAMWLMLI